MSVVVRDMYRGYLSQRKLETKKKKAFLTSDRPCSMYSKSGCFPKQPRYLGGRESVVRGIENLGV